MGMERSNIYIDIDIDIATDIYSYTYIYIRIFSKLSAMKKCHLQIFWKM